MQNLSFENYNQAVREWGKRTNNLIKLNAGAAGVFHRDNSPSKQSSVEQIKDSYKLTGGAISRVSFKFPRTLVFIHKGAGKGMGGTIGSQWKDKLGLTHKTNPDSLGKMATGQRKAKPFYNRTIESQIGELSVIAASEIGDTIVSNILIQ